MPDHENFRKFLNEKISPKTKPAWIKDTLISKIDVLVKEYELFISNDLATDPNFEEQLCNGNDANLNERFWEISVGNRLIKRGHKVSSPNKGADFIVTLPNNNKVYVEAVCATVGTGKNSLPKDWNYDLDILGIPPEIQLRWTSVIHDKIKKSATWGIQSEDFFVIAVNGGQLSPFCEDFYGLSQLPRIVEIAFGIDNLNLLVSKNKDQPSKPYLSHSDSVNNANGQPVNKSIFSKDNYKQVSALFGTCMTVEQFITDKIMHEIDFAVVHNRYAQNKIDRGFFGTASEYSLKEGTNNNLYIDQEDIA